MQKGFVNMNVCTITLYGEKNNNQLPKAINVGLNQANYIVGTICS